ncbi:MAG: ABC transporter permease [Actinobacteria bacterium]|nr:ABC transporter permease [Actinomycetota bacterium]
MTTATAPTADAVRTGQITLGTALSDAATITRRYLTHILRQPRLLIFSTIQPVMFVLLFVYVFGGALLNSPAIQQYGSYKDFLLPGIFVQTVAFGATQTAIALAEDLNKGVIDRFRSLPMARSAVLVGRTVADLVRGFAVVVIMTVVGLIIGFRPQALGLLGAIAIVVAFGFAMSWIYAVVGLSAPNSETAQAASFVVTFPLVFASAVFIPPTTMPDWLRVFAEHNPITHVAEASRALATGIGDVTGPLLWSLAWIAGLLLVFVPLAVNRYRKMS